MNECMPYQCREKFWSIFNHKSSGSKLDVLEFGSGGGHLAKRLSSEGHNVTLIDREDYLQYPELRKNLVLYNLELPGLNKKVKKKFDVIIGIEVVEHVYNLQNLLAECKQMLKPSGVVIFSTPNSHNLKNRLKYLFSANAITVSPVNDHRIVLTPNIVHKTARECKLQSKIHYPLSIIPFFKIKIRDFWMFSDFMMLTFRHSAE